MLPTALLLLATATSGVCAPSLACVNSHAIVQDVIVQRHIQPLYLVGQYQYANLELIQEIRELRRVIAAQGTGSQSSSAVSRACGSCHGGEAVEGSFSIHEMSAADKLRAIRAMATGKMPPDRELPRDLKNALLSELTSPEVSSDDAPPIPQLQEPSL